MSIDLNIFHLLSMAPLKAAKAYRPPEHHISQSRVLKSALLTILGIVFAILLCYHFMWAVQILRNRVYGHLLNNLVFGIGTFIANGGICFRILVYLNQELLDNDIDADHKKYI